MNLFNDIAGDQVSFVLKILARTLFGKGFETFTILRGCGRNGKSLILELMLETIGQYAYKMNKITILNNGKTSGLCPEIAQMPNKPLIIASEPPAEAKFNTSFIKEITKGTKINAQECHSIETQVNMHGTIIIDSNNKLAFQGEIDNAITERLIDIDFLNAYTNDLAKLGTKTSSGGLYKQITTYYKSTGFHDIYIYSINDEHIT